MVLVLSIVQLFLLLFVFTDYVVPVESAPPLLPSFDFQAELSVMGESALIDKETGRLFWEGGSSTTLVESIESKVKSQIGVEHLKATILTCTLLVALCGFLSVQIQDKLNRWTILDTCPSIYRLVATIFFSSSKFILQCIPKFDPIFIFLVYLVYMLESYGSSTRNYLSNAMHGPNEIEAYLREMKHVRPVIEFSVRCFHYENRNWMIPFRGIYNAMRRAKQETSISSQATMFSFLSRKKVVSSVNKGCFNYQQCDDKTVVAVWKRARATVATMVPSSKKFQDSGIAAAPVIKLVLSKVVALADEKTRNEYLLQQRKFVRKYSQLDDYAEFATSIHYDQFKPRLLIVRSPKTTSALKLTCSSWMFWLFTTFGLTVPYRIWLASNCDVLRLIMVKETSYELIDSVSTSWPGTKMIDTGSFSTEKQTGHFQTVMRSLQLPTDKSSEETGQGTSDLLMGGIKDILISGIKGVALTNRTDKRKQNNVTGDP
jgi:TMEM151 family